MRHAGVVHSGWLAVSREDGTELGLSAGRASVIEPGHRAWVVGDEPCVAYDRLIVAAGSRPAGRRIRDLPIGEDTWISLIVRDSRPIQPRGSVRLQAGDELLILAGARDPARLAAVFERDRPQTTDTGSRSEPRGR